MLFVLFFIKIFFFISLNILFFYLTLLWSYHNLIYQVISFVFLPNLTQANFFSLFVVTVIIFFYYIIKLIKIITFNQVNNLTLIFLLLFEKYCRCLIFFVKENAQTTGIAKYC